MKTLGFFLTACVVLAAIRAALAALVVALLVGLIWSAATRPRETATLFGLLIVASLVQNHGLAFLGVLALAVILGAFRRTSNQRI